MDRLPERKQIMDETRITSDSAPHEVRFLAHLREEEQTLAMLLVAVREIRQALLNRDGERLTQALLVEADSFQRSEGMRDKRMAIRQEWAKRLQVTPAEVTLSRMESVVSPEARDELVMCRQRLQEMSEELLQLNRQNGAMIQQTLDLTERIVGQLTDGGSHFTSYNAAGQSESAHVGPLLQWGG
jgi:hypothetical protein